MRSYVEGPADHQGDVYLQAKYFTCRSDIGMVAGCDFNVMFTIDRPARVVWPYIQDFNLWQNSYGHYYSGAFGDLEGKTCRISAKPNDPGLHQYQVLRVIPEYLIVVSQPVLDDGTASTGLPGLGVVSPGFHVVMLNEHGGKTVVSILMEHASLMEGVSGTQTMTEEQALSPWRDKLMVPEWLRKWRDDLVPTLKELVYVAR
jgi:hypothetical protein